MKHWQLQDAKNRFSEVVNKALRDGPQFVTRRGEKPSLLCQLKGISKLSDGQKQKRQLQDWLRSELLI